MSSIQLLNPIHTNKNHFNLSNSSSASFPYKEATNNSAQHQLLSLNCFFPLAKNVQY